MTDHASTRRVCEHEYPETGTWEDLICVHCGARKSPHATPDRVLVNKADVLDRIERLRDWIDKHATGYSSDYAQGFEESILMLADCLEGCCAPDLRIPEAK